MRKLAAAVLIACGLSLLLPGWAKAESARPVVDVIQIGGLLDRVQADFWQHAIEDADARRANALIVQLDSSRSVLSAKRLQELSDSIKNAATPIGIWVGPARAAEVGDDVVRLLPAADVVGVAPDANVDNVPGVEVRVDLRSPTLGDFLVDLDNHPDFEIPTKTIGAGDDARREPAVDVRFSKPSLMARTIHGVTSPGPAYALLMVGLLLAVLEFTTAGIGLAAATGALLLALSALGLGALPVNGFAVAALVFSVFGFSIDLQAGAPRVWTAIGAGAMAFGTLTLYGDGMSVPLIWIVAVFGLTAAFVLAGMPSLIRARFSSPTIGREGFIGELGAAVGRLQPEGVVSIRGGTWRARTNRATPIEDGAAVRVIGIDGLVLDVEPEDGGAKDYRERPKSST